VSESVLRLIGRNDDLFRADMRNKDKTLRALISSSRFLVLGGAGSIGQAVTKEIFKRQPKVLHVVDISENNLVELVRDIRSSLGYIQGDFQTYALDIGSLEYDSFFFNYGKYDYILNLSALKHVRSESDPFTLMRMIQVNILNTEKTVRQAIAAGVKKYFCVSSDKAANPVNMMGASKRIMEMFLIHRSAEIDISTARFPNVAFSDGSLLHGFDQRVKKRQPIVAPSDIFRYFISPQESGELCLIAAVLGNSGDIFFPKLSESFGLHSFADIAEKYLQSMGYEANNCSSESEARARIKSLSPGDAWPCFFSASDTTGEKSVEEFYTGNENIDLVQFNALGVIRGERHIDHSKLKHFEQKVNMLRSAGQWSKVDIVELFRFVLPDFDHRETGKFLDDKM